MLLGQSKRRREHADHTRSLPRRAIERQLSRRDVPLREKTLWRMLYETAARASEVLALDVERLDLANRRAPVRSKGGRDRVGALGNRHRPPAAPHAAAARRDEPHQRAAVSLRAQAAPGTPAPAPRRLPAHRPRPARLRPRPRAPHMEERLSSEQR